MRNMSFMLTVEQMQRGTKTVTRRNGWLFLKPLDRIQPVEKAMGLKKGEKVKKIGEPITITNIRREPLDKITQEDVIAEGFPEMSPQDFIDMYCKANRCKPDQMVTRIEWDWLPF